MKWVGVDFDGTLAKHPDGWFGVGHTGEPIMPMVERVRKWLDEGIHVKIFTARVCEDRKAVPAIDQFCLTHFGRTLEVTCVKDWDCVAIYDDRAITVERDTGRILTVK